MSARPRQAVRAQSRGLAPLGALAGLVLAFVLACQATVIADPKFPELTGRVVDNANLLDAAEESALTSDLEDLENRSTDQLVVVTLPSLQGYAIEDFGYRLGRHWAIGQKDKDNGVLLIVAPNERKVRIEVGRGLEPILTDALSKIIIENGILPRFRSGDFPGGIKTGVRDIISVLTGDAEELKARAQRRNQGDDIENWIALVILILWALIFFAVMWSIIRSIQHGHSPAVKKGGKKKGSGSDWDWSSGSGSGGGWSSGGGGFSGGGGGFGGGGASGGW